MSLHFPLVLMVSLLIPAVAPPKRDAKKDLDKLQGTWAMVSVEYEGKEQPKYFERVQRVRLVIKGNNLILGLPGKRGYEGTVKLDSTKRPKAIDVTTNNGPDKGKTILGIYNLEGDTLQTCFSESGKERPKKFATEAGSGHLLYNLKRAKK